MLMEKVLDKEKYVGCPVCNREMKKKNLPKHLRREHSAEGVINVKKPTFNTSDAKARRAFRKANDKKVVSNHSLRDMSPAQRRRHLDALDRPDREESRAIMDSGRVFHGGGYGLGKSRKH